VVRRELRIKGYVYIIYMILYVYSLLKKMGGKELRSYLEFPTISPMIVDDISFVNN
jgi:hypothetical protein